MSNHTQNLSHAQMIKIIKNGDQRSVNKLVNLFYENHFNYTLDFVLRNNGTSEDAQDIFQLAMMALVKQIREEKFRENSTIKTYLGAISKNLWMLELLRRRRKNKNFQKYTEDQEESYDNRLIEKYYPLENNAELIRKVYNQLKDPQTDILTFYFLEGLSFDEIEENLNLKNNQVVRNKLYRSRKYVTQAFKDHKIDRDYFLVRFDEK